MSPQWAGIVEFNVQLLRQAGEAIDCCLVRALPFEALVGPHLRHVFEHYEALLQGLDGRLVEYDARERDRRVERNPFLARARLVTLVNALRSLDRSRMSGAIDVKFDGGLEEGLAFNAMSTVERELLFVAHHAIHHYAFIKLKLHHAGVELDEAFGVSPATLRHASKVRA